MANHSSGTRIYDLSGIHGRTCHWSVRWHLSNSDRAIGRSGHRRSVRRTGRRVRGRGGSTTGRLDCGHSVNRQLIRLVDHHVGRRCHVTTPSLGGYLSQRWRNAVWDGHVGRGSTKGDGGTWAGSAGFKSLAGHVGHNATGTVRKCDIWRTGCIVRLDALKEQHSIHQNTQLREHSLSSPSIRLHQIEFTFSARRIPIQKKKQNDFIPVRRLLVWDFASVSNWLIHSVTIVLR